MVVKKNIFNYVEVLNNEIRAISPCNITIDRKEYGDDEITELANKLILPGVFALYFPDLDDIAHIVLNYEVDLHKTQNIDDNGNVITIHYDIGETIITREYINQTGMDVGFLIGLLQGRIKFIKDPTILLNMIHKTMQNADLVHFELLVSNMMRRPNSGDKCRLSGDYRGAEIMGQHKQASSDSWLSGMSYQHIDRAITRGLIEGKAATNNPIEQIINEEYV